MNRLIDKLGWYLQGHKLLAWSILCVGLMVVFQYFDYPVLMAVQGLIYVGGLVKLVRQRK